MASSAMSFGPAAALKSPGLSAAASAKLGLSPAMMMKNNINAAEIAKGISPAAAAKARSTAQDFEAVFLNSMFGQMFSGVGEGPYSGGQAAKTWQSFLTDEYSKDFAKSGGIGIADSVYRELIALQEARAK